MLRMRLQLMRLYSMPMAGMVVTLNRSAISSRAGASDRHIRQLAHINLTWLPSLSRADRSKMLVGSVRQIVVARPSFVALLVVISAATRTPVPVSSAPLSLSAAENGSGEGGALPLFCRLAVSPAMQPRASWQSVCRRSKGAVQRGAAAFQPLVGRSVCLSVRSLSSFRRRAQ